MKEAINGLLTRQIDTLQRELAEVNAALSECVRERDAQKASQEILTDALNRLARWDVEPRYLANGHDTVAWKARKALALAGIAQPTTWPDPVE